jgi:hypothetical protein
MDDAGCTDEPAGPDAKRWGRGNALLAAGDPDGVELTVPWLAPFIVHINPFDGAGA